MRRYKNQAIIDLVEKSSLAGGLLRWGVAPDHPEVKNALKNFDDLLENDNFHLFTNVKPTLTLSEIRPYYSAIIKATGADGVRDMTLVGKERSDGPVVINAMDFVDFYNQCPSVESENAIRRIKALSGVRKIAIIGNGNVSLDIARLLTKKESDIEKYNLPHAFYDFCRRNPIQEISIIGRRGVVQSACSVKELRELIAESTFSTQVSQSEIELSLDPNSIEETDARIDIRRRATKKRLEIFQKLAQSPSDSASTTGLIKFRFLLAPFEILHAEGKNLLRCHRTRLSGAPFRLKAESDKTCIEMIEADLVIKSLGFENKRENIQASIADASHHVYRCGWASTGGLGALADSYNDCDQTEQQVYENLSNEPRLFEDPHSFMASQIAMLHRQNSDFPILGKHEYKKFRLREIAAGQEIKDLATLKQIVSDQC